MNTSLFGGMPAAVKYLKRLLQHDRWQEWLFLDSLNKTTTYFISILTVSTNFDAAEGVEKEETDEQYVHHFPLVWFFR